MTTPMRDEAVRDRIAGPHVAVPLKIVERIRAYRASQPYDPVLSQIEIDMNIALAPAPASGRVGAVAAWQELCERDDRTSPEEYPDMCLITQAELAEFMSRSALSPAATPVSEAGGEPDMWSPKLEAIRLLKAEDARQLQILELLETIREQVRLGVKPEHRPDGLMKNLQTAVYGLRGRMPLLNDAAIMAPLQALAKPEPAGGDVREALEGFRSLTKQVMTALMATRGRDDLLLADQVHRADTAARIALSQSTSAGDS